MPLSARSRISNAVGVWYEARGLNRQPLVPVWEEVWTPCRRQSLTIRTTQGAGVVARPEEAC